MRRLSVDLTQRGHVVWFDRVSMPNRGLAVPDEIAQAIDKVDRLLLVVGPQALVSNPVKAEWHHALATCKPIHPLLRLSGYDDLPPELKGFDVRDFRDDARYAAELDRLVQQMGMEAVPLGKLVCVPKLPSHFIPRPDDLAGLKQMALADLQRPVALVGTATRLGAYGSGGRGKTTLAADRACLLVLDNV